MVKKEQVMMHYRLSPLSNNAFETLVRTSHFARPINECLITEEREKERSIRMQQGAESSRLAVASFTKLFSLTLLNLVPRMTGLSC